MDPRIPPTSGLGTAILAALQTSPGEPQIQALLALVGQNLDLLLLEAGAGRATLRMPTGQVFQAEGELDFPPGTRLTVQVQLPAAESAGPRLKLAEAVPPPPAPILVPLVHGEGSQLLARLRAEDLPPALLPLARLMTEFAPAKALPAPAAAPPPAAPGRPFPAGQDAPPQARILEWLRTLPAPQLQELQRLLLPQSAGRAPLPAVAEALAARLVARASLEAGAQAAAPPSGGRPAAAQSLPVPIPEEPSQQAQASTRSETPGSARPAEAAGAPRAASTRGKPATGLHPPPLLHGVPVPASSPLPVPASADPPLQPLVDLLRLLLSSPAEAAGSAPSTLAPGPKVGPPLRDSLLGKPLANVPLEPPARGKGTVPGASPPAGHARPGEAPHAAMAARLPAPGPAGDSKPVREAHPGAADPRPASVETWATWLSEGTKVLSDPLASPREAPFHLAQAKEGTAFFELPLPWEADGKVLQMWVEADGGRRSGQRGEGTVRVLVGLQFSALGETRVGLVRTEGRIQVRIWAEHPELLAARESHLRRDLADLGPDLDLQVLTLGEPGKPVPSLRALAVHAGFQALG